MYNNFNKFRNNKNKNNNFNYKYVNKENEKSLEKEEEYKLITDWLENKNKKSLNRILGAYKKLVVSFSKKYLSYGLPQEDLIQEGMMGLIYAINKFDIFKGYRLSTYAHWWIKAMIQNYVLKNWSIVKNGTTTSQKMLFFSFNKIKKTINFHSLDYMGIAEVEKISKMLNIKPLEIENLQTKLKMGDQSLNQPVNDNEDGQELISLLKDSNPSHDILIQKNNDNKIKNDWLVKSIELLNSREKFIINSRKLKEKPDTLDRIAKELKISKERVRQIEVNTLQKLQKNILKISNETKDFFIN